MRSDTILPVLFAVLLLSMPPGCTDKERTTNTFIELPAPVGHFPGTLPADHLPADDGMAFSPAAENADTSNLRYFPSGAGEGILLFATTDAGSLWHLYAAACHDGRYLTPPVRLFCANEDATQAPDLDRAAVLFLENMGVTDGDALVVVPRLDLDDPAGTDPASEPNWRLYATTYDRSLRWNPQSALNPDVRYGFDSSLDPVDGSDVEDVHLVGLLTDGLVGSARFPVSSPSEYRQGHPTSCGVLLWSQKADAASPERLHSRVIDLGTGLLGAASEVPLDSSAGATDEVVWSTTATELNAYNNVAFFVRTDASGDEVLLAAIFDSATGAFMTAAHRLRPDFGPSIQTALPPCQAGGARIFGSDEALAPVTGIFAVTVQNLAPAEVSLVAFQLDPNPATTGSFDPTLGTDLMEIDAGAGTAAAWSILLPDATWTLNRPGTCLFAAFLQNRSETTTTPALWLRGLRTRSAGAAHRPLSEDFTAALRLDTDATTLAVEGFLLPQDLAWRGIQADPSVFTAVWKQDAAGADTLRFNTVTADLTPAWPSPPTLAAGATEGTIGFIDGELALSGVTVTDNGGAGGTPGTAALYYVRDAQTGTHASFRAFQYNTATSVETNIGSLTVDPADDIQPQEAMEIRVVSVPANTDTVGAPGYAGSIQHIFLREYRYHDSAGTAAWRHRSFFKNATSTAPGDRFTPPADGSTAAAPPSTVDSLLDRDAQLLYLGTYGESVCAFFRQGGNLFYNEYIVSGARWWDAATLVDNEGAGEGLPADPVIFGQVRVDAPGSYAGCLVLWTRTLAGGQTRLFARIRY
jgi:hypothetical protein